MSSSVFSIFKKRKLCVTIFILYGIIFVSLLYTVHVLIFDSQIPGVEEIHELEGDVLSHEGSYRKVAENSRRPVKGFIRTAQALYRDGPNDVNYKKQLLLNTKPSKAVVQITTAAIRKAAPLTLNDIFISVKTTGGNHHSRLDVILQTWYTLAQDQTYIFTDVHDPTLIKRIGSSHVINTNCSEGHSRVPLCCKMSAEYDYFIDSGKKWLCHVDDDNYVNVEALVRYLSQYPPTSSWYLGRSSTKTPVTIVAQRLAPEPVTGGGGGGTPVTFWFATGGAGFCVSRALALRMVPYARYGGLLTRGEEIKLPDDVTMGYLIAHYLNVNLTTSPLFHSHLENLSKILPADFHKQVTFSYHLAHGNLIQTGRVVPLRDDVTRLKTLHCILHPNSTELCRGKTRRGAAS